MASAPWPSSITTRVTPPEASWASLKSMNGRPATSRSALGRRGPVRLAIRVPRPPASTATGYIGSDDHQRRALVVEAEPDLRQSEAAHRCPQVGLGLRVEEQEPATASADQLAAGCPALQAGVDPGVDLQIGGTRGALALQLPLEGHELGKGGEVAADQGLEALLADLRHPAEVAGGLGVACLRLGVLVGKHLGGGAPHPGVEQ